MIEKDDQNKNYGEETQNASSYNADNDYGLPEAEYSPIEREQPLIHEDNVSFPTSAREEEEPQQKKVTWPLWVALVLILGLAGVFVFFFVFDETENEEIAQKPVQETFIVEEEPEPVEQPAEEDWQPVNPEPQEGSVSTITSRTGNYYLIVGSFIDGDLARDYGQKLAKEGISSKIIEPSGTRKFYRLSVKDAESVEALNNDLDSMRSKFGENVWIVKY